MLVPATATLIKSHTYNSKSGWGVLPGKALRGSHTLFHYPYYTL